jgi:hypothetical protein
VDHGLILKIKNLPALGGIGQFEDVRLTVSSDLEKILIQAIPTASCSLNLGACWTMDDMGSSHLTFLINKNFGNWKLSQNQKKFNRNTRFGAANRIEITG